MNQLFVDATLRAELAAGASLKRLRAKLDSADTAYAEHDWQAMLFLARTVSEEAHHLLEDAAARSLYHDLEAGAIQPPRHPR